MRRLVVLGALLAGVLGAQTLFTESQSATLVSAAQVVTVQQPASASMQVVFQGAYIYCSVACSWTLERNGTAATSTTQTPTQVNPTTNIAATATGWVSSNVGVGTVIGNYSLGAGQSLSINLAGVFMTGNGTGSNLTLRSSSVTGTTNCIIQWTERVAP
jgi:hypothetical protein